MLMRAAARAAAAGEPEPSEKSPEPPEKVADQPWQHHRLRVVWDASDRDAAALARLLCDEFGAFLCFAELHDSAAVAAVVAENPEVPADEVAREGGLSAVLPEGIFVNGCEEHPQVLLYELRYLLTVAPPDRAELARFEHEVQGPLAALRARHEAGGSAAGRWWHSEAAFAIVSRSMAEHKMCIVDGFLDPQEVCALRRTAEQLHEGGHLERGIVEQRHADRSYFGEESENKGDFLNISDKPRKWTVQGDQRIWINDSDGRAGSLKILTGALDEFLTSLRRSGSADPKVASRLRRISFRENTMVALYPGNARGRYMKHSDTGRRAVLTALYYLNCDWRPEHGGALRLFHSTPPTRVRRDVAPLANRLLLFWATEECPHEVRPACRDRFAMTTWFLDGRQHFEAEAGGGAARLANLLRNANVIAGGSDDEAFEGPAAPSRDGPPAPLDAELLRKLRIACRHQALAEAEARSRPCAHCGASAPPELTAPTAAERAAALTSAAAAAALLGVDLGGADLAGAGAGRLGGGEHEDLWYCQACWDARGEEGRRRERQREQHEELRREQERLWRERFACSP
ncbi:unnamed protein product [Prorocentrum cordatum]|uniref:Fe2OG dioxygenase domain-containing protein n=1 Tax=Prorocentrum cordatum TaxID=2364126 RepID=A0ABN9PHR1_9DINO|nr:unnamed protein product [Polarella glacialis]